MNALGGKGGYYIGISPVEQLSSQYVSDYPKFVGYAQASLLFIVVTGLVVFFLKSLVK